jgi:anaerobic selenocysteine-containing dehydrogenase
LTIQESIKELASDINAGKVDMLVILGGNPVYDAPVDLNFKDLVQKVTFTAHLGIHNNETSGLCQWHIPEAHYLEAWSDARAIDGTVSIVQPLIEPLYQGKSAHEMLTAFTEKPERAGYEIVREYWLSRIGSLSKAQPAQAAQAAGAMQAQPAAAPQPKATVSTNSTSSQVGGTPDTGKTPPSTQTAAAAGSKAFSRCRSLVAQSAARWGDCRYRSDAENCNLESRLGEPQPAAGATERRH